MSDRDHDNAAGVSPSSQQDKNAPDVVRPKLGLSKVIYAFGMSARDALVTFAVSTVAITAALFFGGKKFPALERIARIPEKIGGLITNRLGGSKTGELKNSVTVALGVASVISYVAHVPGVIRGPRKIAEAEQRFDGQVDMNTRLAKANTLLQEDNDRLKAALEAVQTGGSKVSRLQAEPAEAVSRGA